MRPYQTETLQPWQREIVERTVEVESGRFAARRLALITPRHKPFMPAAEMAATVVQWPNKQGGMFRIVGKQGKPPDGWAIPLVALGVQGPIEYIADLLNKLDAGWQLTRVGDEERSRGMRPVLVHEDVLEKWGASDPESEAPFVALRDALAPRPPSPVSQGEER